MLSYDLLEDRRIDDVTINKFCFLFLVALHLFSNRSQKTSNCGKNINDTLGSQAAQAQVVSRMIMLRNSSHGSNFRVCMGIFTIGFRRYKYWKVLNKNDIPCVYCHFSELSLPWFPTPKRKTRRHSSFRKSPSERRKIPAQNDRAATNPTENPSTNVPVSFQLNSKAIRVLRPKPSGSLVSIIPDLNIVKTRVHIHHQTRPLKTQFLF